MAVYQYPDETREYFMTGSGKYLMKCKFKMPKAIVGGEFLEFLAYSKLGVVCRTTYHKNHQP